MRLLTIAGTVFLLALPAAAQQQDNSAPAQQQQSQSGNKDQQNPRAQDQKTQDQQKKPDQKKSAADANPFPEAESEKAAQQQSQPQDQQDPSVPSAPQPSAVKGQASPGKKPTADDQNPFPEAKSEKAQQQQEQGDQGDDSSYSSSQVHLNGTDLAPATGDEDEAPIQARSPLPYDPKLAKKDAQIGDYYLETGDYKGAYDRYVEAARSDPGNAEAVWGLAESAHRLRMNDVAIKNYRLYLAALPNGPHAKEIRKTLKDMGLEPGS